MTIVGAAPPDGLRVVICVKFAAPAPSDERQHFKDRVIEDKRVLHVIEVSGTYDMMFEVACPEAASYQHLLDEFAPASDHLLERYEANLICRRLYYKHEGAPHALWVPTVSGRQRVDHRNIDLVTAEGDYVRVHSGGRSWLLHATMNKLAEQLGADGFLRLNRSSIVRPDFISSLLRDERHWTVVLADGSRQRLAKGRAGQVVAALKADSSIPRVSSSRSTSLAEIGTRVNEMITH